MGGNSGIYMPLSLLYNVFVRIIMCGICIHYCRRGLIWKKSGKKIQSSNRWAVCGDLESQGLYHNCEMQKAPQREQHWNQATFDLFRFGALGLRVGLRLCSRWNIQSIWFLSVYFGDLIDQIWFNDIVGKEWKVQSTKESSDSSHH